MFGAILRPRACGKTTELVKVWKNSPDSVLVVPSRDLGRHLHERHGIPYDNIVSIDDIRNGRVMRGRNAPTNLLFDDFDLMLHELIPGLERADNVIVTATGRDLDAPAPKEIEIEPEPTQPTRPKRFKV